MREPAVGGEYPVLCVDAGAASYDESVVVAASIVEACSAPVNVEDLLAAKRR